MIRVVHPGSGSRILISYPSRIQRSKRHRIRIRNTGFISILPDILCPRVILREDGIEKNALGLSVHLLKAHEYQVYNQKNYQ
jgi:hypothetical protein